MSTIEEMLGIEPNEPKTERQEMCACGVLPAPCGCVTVVLEPIGGPDDDFSHE